jgi:glutamate dehydrogenase (NAD(P)+)
MLTVASEFFPSREVSMTVAAALTANPLEDATAQLQHAVNVLEYDCGTYTMLATSRREMSVSVPIRRNDGSVTVVVGHRVQHNFSRGPAKGGLRRTSPWTRFGRSPCG